MTTQKNILPLKATHPGSLIKDELEVRSDINQRELAKQLGVKASLLSEVINGKRSITADMAVLLEKVLEISASYWMRFQSQYDIDKARIKERNLIQAKNIEIWKIIKEYVPIKYFKKLGYLSEVIQEDIAKIKEIYSVKSIEEFVEAYAQSLLAFYRKSEKLQIDEKNLFAWSSIAMYEAGKQELNTFNFDNISQLCVELNSIFYSNKNTIEEVKKVLNLYGIKLVLLQKFEKTPVDGFSFWSGNNPAIALTLRHTRIDNFAFTLMHEIAHIDLHLRSDRTKRILDIKGKGEGSLFEKEADLSAQKSLIPTECWDSFKNKLSLTDDEIFEIGDRYNINPAIILGRCSYETGNYAVRTKIDKKLN